MISKLAVEKFLASRTRDLGLLKTASRSEVEQELDLLRPKPQFYGPSPFINQLVGFLICVRCRSVLLNFDMGTGKSKIALDSFRWLKRAGHVRRALILVPTSVLVDSWEEQCRTHAPDLSCRFARGDRKEREADLRSNADVVVITYQGWLRFVTQKDGQKGGLKIDSVLADEFAALFDLVVMDESTAVMNIHSLQYKACKRLALACRCRFLMTGTPFGRDLQAAWSQFFLVDFGAALGSTLGLFRQAFFDEKKGFFGGYEYSFRHEMLPELHRRMRHSCIRYSVDECYDLPAKIFTDRPITFSEEMWDYYKAVVERARKARGLDELQNVFMSMRQIASGFATVGDQTIDFSPNVKLDALVDLLHEINEDEKVVIFNHFIHSGDLISKRLKTEKIKHARLYSGTADRGGELNRFQTDPKCRAFIVNNQSGAMGLNLQVARYVIFYEMPASPIIRDQAERRVYRVGQTKTVFYYDLFVRRSVEEKLLRYLREGKDFFDSVVRGLETLH